MVEVRTGCCDTVLAYNRHRTRYIGERHSLTANGVDGKITRAVQIDKRPQSPILGLMECLTGVAQPIERCMSTSKGEVRSCPG
jgi:hypothetical protein